MGIKVAKTGSHEENFGLSWLTLFGGQNKVSLWNSDVCFNCNGLESKTLDRQVWNGHEDQKVHLGTQSGAQTNCDEILFFQNSAFTM